MRLRTTLFVLFLSLWAVRSENKASNSIRNYFTLAVYEYATTHNPQVNLEHYRNATQAAKMQGADIIVFPEVGLIPHEDRNSPLPEPIPDPKASNINPCDESDTMRSKSPYLVELSCLAKEYSIYISANTIERLACGNTSGFDSCPRQDGEFHFNANAVFDPTGRLIARYRKRFPFFEPAIDVPPKPESVVFETPFGRFGLLICFDMIFKEAAVDLVEDLRPDYVLLSTYWFNELPFLSASQYFFSWALGNAVNIAAANIHIPSIGTLGSLITQGEELTYTHFAEPGASRLLVSKIRPGMPSADVKITIDDNSVASPAEKTNSSLSTTMLNANYTISNFQNYTMLKLVGNSGSLEACWDHFCCNLKYTTANLTNDYYFGAANGILSIKNHYYIYQQVCVMFTCSQMNPGNNCTVLPILTQTVFDEVIIEGNFTTRHVYPSVLASNMVIVPKSKWQYTRGVGRIATGPEVNVPLASVSLFGRLYDEDPPYRP